MKLTAKQRSQLKAEDFAVPGKRKLPIHDKTHTLSAWRLLPVTQDLSESERAVARLRIIARAKQQGIDTSGWEKAKVSQEAWGGGDEPRTRLQRKIAALFNV